MGTVTGLSFLTRFNKIAVHMYEYIGISCPNEIIVYCVHKHINILKHSNTTGMRTINSIFASHVESIREKEYFLTSNLTFSALSLAPSHVLDLYSYCFSLNFDKYIRVYVSMTIQYLEIFCSIPITLSHIECCYTACLIFLHS